MAEAEDLKSSKCGFDPHPGHITLGVHDSWGIRALLAKMGAFRGKFYLYFTPLSGIFNLTLLLCGGVWSFQRSSKVL